MATHCGRFNLVRIRTYILSSCLFFRRLQLYALRKETRTSYHATPRGSFSVPAEGQDDHSSLSGLCASVQDSLELRKIKKVQSFFRGWLCRRRWKQIVEEYIRSPHAESMRKRNHLVFSMVEAEEEYLEQLEVSFKRETLLVLYIFFLIPVLFIHWLNIME